MKLLIAIMTDIKKQSHYRSESFDYLFTPLSKIFAKGCVFLYVSIKCIYDIILILKFGKSILKIVKRNFGIRDTVKNNNQQNNY